MIPRWKIIFALKAFTAAMLALYIALSLDLERPYWAMTTVYVVFQPFSGAIRSKGTYRLIGTLTGASAGLALLGIFGTWQFGLICGITAWFMLCVYFSLRDRSPRFYLFLLAGLTSLLVAWPTTTSVTSQTLFLTAASRFEEVSIGILCAVFIDSIFFPRRVKPVLDDMIATWFRGARTWSLDVLSGQNQKTMLDRARLAAEADQIGMLTIHLDYEMQDNPQRAAWIRVLQSRMLLLLPILSSIDDRIGELRRDPKGMPAPLAAVLEKICAWLKDGNDPEQLRALKRELEKLDTWGQEQDDWRRILVTSLAVRLADFLDLSVDCHGLLRQIETPLAPASARLKQLAQQKVVAPHRDHMLIFWALGASLLSMAVTTAFWYATGWPDGSAAAMMALLMSAFFGSIDNPIPMLRLLVKVYIFATILDTAYVFVILPHADSFVTVAILLAPALLTLGLVAANPMTFVIALIPIAMMSFSNMATPGTSFIPFLDQMIAMDFGCIVILLITSVVKGISVEFSAK
ncbi:FUSC family protein, partial [Thioclava sp. BHET1]